MQPAGESRPIHKSAAGQRSAPADRKSISQRKKVCVVDLAPQLPDDFDYDADLDLDLDLDQDRFEIPSGRSGKDGSDGARPCKKAVSNGPRRGAARSRVAEMYAAPIPSSGELRVGKYRGLTFEEVHAADRDYCDWVMQNAQDGALGDFAEWLLHAAPSEAKSSKIYLSVPFSRKDFAKRLGARWDADKKMWYAPDDSYEQLLAAFPT